VLAIADELTEAGFVLRYRTDATDDALSGKEGTFVICSFWLVSALAIVGQTQRARDLMERLVKVASRAWAGALFGATLMSATFSMFPPLGRTPPP
jgi:GH15 family glucan-1,4-alpha-glucosidase